MTDFAGHAGPGAPEIDERALPFGLRNWTGLDELSPGMLSIEEARGLPKLPPEAAAAVLLNALGLVGDYQLRHRGEHIESRFSALYTGDLYLAGTDPRHMNIHVREPGRVGQAANALGTLFRERRLSSGRFAIVEATIFT